MIVSKHEVNERNRDAIAARNLVSNDCTNRLIMHLFKPKTKEYCRASSKLQGMDLHSLAKSHGSSCKEMLLENDFLRELQ